MVVQFSHKVNLSRNIKCHEAVTYFIPLLSADGSVGFMLSVNAMFCDETVARFSLMAQCSSPSPSWPLKRLL